MPSPKNPWAHAVEKRRGKGPGGWITLVRGCPVLSPDSVVREFNAGYSTLDIARFHHVEPATIENVLRWHFWERENGRRKG